MGKKEGWFERKRTERWPDAGRIRGKQREGCVLVSVQLHRHDCTAQNSKQALQHSPELFVDVDAVGEAVETGLKDLMLFLFFGMPRTSSALLSTAAAALKLEE